MLPVRHIDISVLKPSVENKPAIRNHQGATINGSHVPEAHLRDPETKSAKHSNDSDIGQPNLLLPRAREKLGVLVASGERLDRPEVISDSADRATSHSGHQVSRPSKDQMSKKPLRSVQTSAQRHAKVLDKPLALLQGLFSSHVVIRNMRFTQSHVIGERMVNSVRPLPREVRHQKHRVEEIANSILDKLVVRERTVATLMGNNPAASCNCSGHRCIGHPNRQHSKSEGNKLPANSHAGQAQNQGDGGVHHRLESVALEAVRRNSLHNLLLVRIDSFLQSNTFQTTELHIGQINVDSRLVDGLKRCCNSPNRQAGRGNSSGPPHSMPEVHARREAIHAGADQHRREKCPAEHFSLTTPALLAGGCFVFHGSCRCLCMAVGGRVP
mmetsp:Transcript_21086/g.58103  ORF Transcript_21086/g.58103 Transcript_21086/m.58103 type:complete len:384 (+) Transcript_21086:720-1871(+)